jgi:hypothetical protein
MEDKNSKKWKGGGGSANGFKALGLTDDVYRGIVRMGFRVRSLVVSSFVGT